MSEEIGKAIKDAFVFLKPIFSDTARILKIVEETMNRNKLTALWGSGAVWGRSFAFYGDYGWLTHYLSRLFVVSPQNNAKPNFNKKIGAFVNVYFAPEILSQPIIVYGVIQSAEEDIWPLWQSLLAVNNGPQFITSDVIQEWKEYKDVNYPALEALAYQVCPLTDVNNKEIVESICHETVTLFNSIRSQKSA